MSKSLRSHGLYNQSILTVQPVHGLAPWNYLGQNTGEGSLSLLQEIFQTQNSNQDLLHCRWVLYQLSYVGSPRLFFR